MSASNSYLPGLHGLRFYGALIVLISHLEAAKAGYDLDPNWWLPIPGKIGVILFFVLSGYLITWLLFRERQKTQTISLSSFFIRRMLRIAPLYFLIVLGSLYLTGIENYSASSLVALLLILPNFASVSLPFAGQVWSIGVEEQFYLVQPLLTRFLRVVPLTIALVMVVFSNEILLIIEAESFRYTGDFPLPWLVWGPLRNGSIYYACIAIGCLSYLLLKFHSELVERLIFSRTAQVLNLALIVLLLAVTKLRHGEHGVDYRLYAFAFAVLVLNISRNSDSILKLENPFYRFYGDLSYGIYMYHPICLAAVFSITSQLMPGRNDLFANVVMYGLTFLLVTSVSWLSFQYFERPFLQLKERFRHPAASTETSKSTAPEANYVH